MEFSGHEIENQYYSNKKNWVQIRDQHDRETLCTIVMSCVEILKKPKPNLT